MRRAGRKVRDCGGREVHLPAPPKGSGPHRHTLSVCDQVSISQKKPEIHVVCKSWQLSLMF